MPQWNWATNEMKLWNGIAGVPASGIQSIRYSLIDFFHCRKSFIQFNAWNDGAISFIPSLNLMKWIALLSFNHSSINKLFDQWFQSRNYCYNNIVSLHSFHQPNNCLMKRNELNNEVEWVVEWKEWFSQLLVDGL